MKRTLAGICLFVTVLVGCDLVPNDVSTKTESSDEGVTSSPAPTPVPTAPPLVPKTKGPLRPSGSNFMDKNGKRVYLSGAIVCCEDAKPHGWPLVTKAALDEIAAGKGNFTHVRIGPNNTTGEGLDYVGHKIANELQVDLNEWNPLFWARLREVIEYARSLGIYVEVSLIDIWVMRNPQFSAWTLENNINGVHQSGCSTLKKAPTENHERWLRKVIEEVGAYDNVLFEIGNESFVCANANKLSTAWEFGIAQIVRDELAKRGFGFRPIGTNSQRAVIEDDGIIDYINVHSLDVQNRRNKPVMVNEYKTSYSLQLGAAGMEAKIREAYAKGTTWHIWRGELLKPDYLEALARLKKFREEIGE